MRILGIQKDHNASACLFYNSDLIYYNQEERLSRIKKDSGIPFSCLKEIYKICPEIDAVVISGYDHIRHENTALISLLKKIGFSLSRNFQWFSNYKGHHYVHALKAFYDSGYDEALILVSDGKGSTYFLSNGGQAVETTSVFTASKNKGFNLVYKRLFTPDNTENVDVIWNSEFESNVVKTPNWLNKDSVIEIRNDYDVGYMYEGVSRALNFNDEGGKMLGLQSYGFRDDDLPFTLTFDDKFNMSVFKFSEYCQNQGFNTDLYPLLNDQDRLVNFSYHVQKTFEYIQWERIKDFVEKTESKNLIITGGCALNVVANTYFRKNLSKDINLFIEPVCGDEGNCIGAVYSYIKDRLSQHSINPLEHLYICGTEPSYDFDLLDHETVYHEVTDSDIVKLLIEKNPVALFQGKGEAGPRALGNRSLLFDPRNTKGKDYINLIKGREPFRPFGCSVMLDKANDWFDMEGIEESPYMMYAVNVNDDKRDMIPSVVHIDNTSRIQTVSKEQNQNLYNLLECFYKDTNVPLLLNTSFNTAGDPIVETIEDAIRSLRKSAIEYLYLPEIKKLIYIKNT